MFLIYDFFNSCSALTRLLPASRSDFRFPLFLLLVRTWVIDELLQLCSVCFVPRFYLGYKKQRWPFQNVEAELAWWFCRWVVTCLVGDGNRRVFLPPLGAGSQTSRECILNWTTAKPFTGWRRLWLVWDVVPCLGSLLCTVTVGRTRQQEASVPSKQLGLGSIEYGKGRKIVESWDCFLRGSYSIDSKQERRVVESFIC